MIWDSQVSNRLTSMTVFVLKVLVIGSEDSFPEIGSWETGVDFCMIMIVIFLNQ